MDVRLYYIGLCVLAGSIGFFGYRHNAIFWRRLGMIGIYFMYEKTVLSPMMKEFTVGHFLYWSIGILPGVTIAAIFFIGALIGKQYALQHPEFPAITHHTHFLKKGNQDPFVN